MRIRGLLSTFAIALVPATLGAQSPAPPQFTGSLDFGVRGTTVSGDAARYERYRDLGNGLFLDDTRMHREHEDWLFDLGADHVGRRDQRYTGSVARPGKLKVSGMYDQIPMLLSDSTQTLFAGIGTGVLTIDNAIQSQVQANPSSLTNIFNQQAVTFDTRTTRKIADGKFEYLANNALTFTGHFRQTNRDGVIPFGGSFGHSSLVEMPAPTEHDLTDVEGGAEYAHEALLLRGGYTGSWFHNNVTTVEFDNPYRAVDSTSAPSRGRTSLAPSNSFIGVNGFASVKLAHRTRVSAYVSTGMLKDAGDALMPQTINTATTPAPVARTAVEGEARTSSVNLTFVSRPSRYADISVRYKTYDYENRTPEFLMKERVSYDNAPAAVSPAIPTEPFGVVRHTFDADFRTSPAGGYSAGVGYSRLFDERTHRIFESTTDDVVRLTFDKVSAGWFTLRTKYEHGHKRGEGIEEGERELLAIGEQPGMRHFDLAERDRDRITILATVMPIDWVAVNGSVAAGKDDYIESEFGLRDNTHRVYSAGLDVTPTERVLVAGSYSFERYNALSRSRQASTAAEFINPARNWATDATDKVHSVIASVEIDKILEKINLRLAYDLSRARARYDYITGAVVDRTLPDEVVLPSALPPPVALTPTLSQLMRGTMDATYALNERVSVGFSWWYEDYKVSDFTLDVEANPELVRGQALLMGYLYRPYTANTFWGRLIYAW